MARKRHKDGMGDAGCRGSAAIQAGARGGNDGTDGDQERTHPEDTRGDLSATGGAFRGIRGAGEDHRGFARPGLQRGVGAGLYAGHAKGATP